MEAAELALKEQAEANEAWAYAQADWENNRIACRHHPGLWSSEFKSVTVDKARRTRRPQSSNGKQQNQAEYIKQLYVRIVDDENEQERSMKVETNKLLRQANCRENPEHEANHWAY